MEHETQAIAPTDTAPVETTAAPTRRTSCTAAPAVPALPKQKRTPAIKPRSLEEINMLDAKKMTSAESVLYINALRDALLRQQNQNEELQKVAKSGFEQFHNADDSYLKVKAQYDADLALAKQIINTAAKSINLIGGQRNGN